MRLSRNGRDVTVTARPGVVLTSGSSWRSQEIRQKYLTALGRGIPSVLVPRLHGTRRVGMLLAERQSAGSVVDDQIGERYINEAAPYVERRDPISAPEVRGTATIPGSDLAALLGVPVARQISTVLRYNAFAREGVDEGDGLGEGVLDYRYGNPVRPNPACGKLTTPPFYAVQVWQADLGTEGGRNRRACTSSRWHAHRRFAPQWELLCTGEGKVYPSALLRPPMVSVELQRKSLHNNVSYLSNVLVHDLASVSRSDGRSSPKVIGVQEKCPNLPC